MADHLHGVAFWMECRCARYMQGIYDPDFGVSLHGDRGDGRGGVDVDDDDALCLPMYPVLSKLYK